VKKRKDINAQALGRKRWKGITKEERSRFGKEAVKKRKPPPDPKVRQKLASIASRSYWDSMTAEQRSAEMKRRARVRKRNKAAREKENL